MKCKSCGIPFEDHLGIIGTCKLYQDALVEVDLLRKGLKAIQNVVDEQANNKSLWEKPKTNQEDNCQIALRKLHNAIEGVTDFNTKTRKGI